jgi:hypothetical protein
MSPNEALLHHFYKSFQKRDFTGMQSCYADEAHFSDPVFQNLNAAELKAMWEMLCLRGKDLQLSYNIITANESEGAAFWTAHYTFSQTGKKVINRITSRFQFSAGKIKNQVDDFSFYKWARQALGTPGLLLGWTPFLKNKVRKSAMISLHKFMQAKPSALTV